jgi:hypothetical protein
MVAAGDVDEIEVMMLVSRSLSISSLFPLIVLGALASSGCYYDDPDCQHDGYCGQTYDPTPPPSDEVADAKIDTGATITDIDAGHGAGVFVEYQAGGKWHVFTSCDTLDSKYGCTWDVIVSTATASELKDYGSDGLESNDWLSRHGSNGVRFVADNDYDFDGFFVETAAGSSLRVDVYLDDKPAPRYIYWVGEGGLHEGSPTNPIDLVPGAP